MTATRQARDGVRTFRARVLWLGPGRIYAPGELRVAGGRIIGAGRTRAGRIPPRAILPGLVNAHAHLQLAPLIRARRQFVPWVRAVMAEQATRSGEELAAQALRAVHELLEDGVCAVGEIDATGMSPHALRRVPMGGTCYRELTGFHLGPHAARKLVADCRPAGSRHCRAGLSPHAPYSVSPALFRAARRRGLPLAVHVAETAEEIAFLHHGAGPFRDLLADLGRLPAGYRPAGIGPVAYLDRLGVLGPRTALIHAQHMTESEARTAAGRGSPVVVCPGTIRYFRRNPPPVPDWLSAGLIVALGTDSIASNKGLSVRAEMGLARRMWPALAPETVLAMATAHGGLALGRASLGGLCRGGAASFVAVPMAGSFAASLDAFTAGELVPTGVWLRGRRVRRRLLS